jgi:uncharacterized protein (TIGR00251 family)
VTPVVLRVRVIPRARADALSADGSGGLRARLTAPPVEGAANRALIDLVARALRVRRGDVELVRGERGRDKLVAVHGLSEADVAARVRALDVDNAERRG